MEMLPDGQDCSGPAAADVWPMPSPVPPFQGQAERSGTLPPGEEKAQRGHSSSLPEPEGSLQES